MEINFGGTEIVCPSCKQRASFHPMTKRRAYGLSGLRPPRLAASAGTGAIVFRNPNLGNSSNAYAYQWNDSYPRKGTRSIGTPVEKQ